MDQTYRQRPIDVKLPEHGVYLLESHHAPGFRMTTQRHSFLEIFYVLNGSGAFHIDGRSYACRKGDVVMVPIQRSHRLEDASTGPLELYGICAAPQVWQAEPALLQHIPPGPLPVSSLLGAQVRADLRRLLYEQTLARPGSQAWIVGQTLQLLVHLARCCDTTSAYRLPEKSSSRPECRESVERYLAELPHRFFEPTDLDQEASALGMSRRRFTHLFREATGSSWSSYLTRLRVEYARQLLQETNRSIAGVAFESGFEDLSSFYRAFKRHLGTPPHAWRQSIQARNSAR